MKYLVFFFALFIFSLFCGCTKTSTGVLTPFQQVGCDIETAVTTSFASGVATAMTCSNQAQIQKDLQTAFGNANLCKGSVAQATNAQMKDSILVKPKGVIGNIACPIAVSTALGFLTNSVPQAWGCSSSTSASVLNSTLVSLCETAVPI